MKKLFLFLSFAFLISPLFSQQVGEMTLDEETGKNVFKKKGFSPYAGRNFPTNVYWGDSHLHTSNSLDARAFGVILGPEEAYRLARGEEITASHGEKVKLSRPLDWLVVSDHSDGMGAMNEIVAGNPRLLQDPTVKDWYIRINKGGNEALMATMDVINSFALGDIPEILLDERFSHTIWDDYIDIAEKYNDPGKFSSHHWLRVDLNSKMVTTCTEMFFTVTAAYVLVCCSLIPLQRVSIPEDLWSWMENYEQQTGGQVLAIAHNGNLSNGIMFPVETNPATGEPLDANYAERRAKWEPAYEATQIKGDGEAHGFLSPDDEFAGYELWDKGNLNLSVEKKPEMLQYEYAREALKNGLVMEDKYGTNPVQVWHDWIN